jgi:hypothetical protein
MIGIGATRPAAVSPSPAGLSFIHMRKAHKGKYCADLTLVLTAFSLTHRERVGVRGLLRCGPPALTRTFSQKERGRSPSPCQPPQGGKKNVGKSWLPGSGNNPSPHRHGHWLGEDNSS